MRTLTAFARFFTIAFHPLLIPVLGMFILFNLNTYVGASVPGPAKQFVLIITFINTAMAPALATILLKRTGLISSILLSQRNERLFPLVITSMFFILTYYLVKKLTLPSLVYYYIMGASLLVLLVLLLTFKWKVSIHMASMGGLTGFLIATSMLLRTDITWLIMLVILTSGFVGAARLQLKAHTPIQVYAGFLLGMTVMIVLYLILRY